MMQDREISFVSGRTCSDLIFLAVLRKIEGVGDLTPMLYISLLVAAILEYDT